MVISKQVLIVDDNEIDSFILAKVIDRTQYQGEVICKNWASEALDHLRENDHPQGVLPQVIFLDLNMPLMNGFEFLEQFSQLSARILNYCQIVVITTSDHHLDRQRALNHPCVMDYLLKPADHQQVLQILHNSLQLVPVYKSS